MERLISKANVATVLYTFNHNINQHSEIVGAAGEAVLIKVHEVHHE
jgi:hypothetical protein